MSLRDREVILAIIDLEILKLQRQQVEAAKDLKFWEQLRKKFAYGE